MRNWTKRTTFLAAFGLALIIMSGIAAVIIRAETAPEKIDPAKVARYKILNKSTVWEAPTAKVVWQLEGWQFGVLKPDFNKWFSGTVANTIKWFWPDPIDKEAKGAVSYTTVVQSMYSGGHYNNKIEYPYAGQYDHGANFDPPSEFLATNYGNYVTYTEYDDGTICINPSRNPKYPEPIWGGKVNMWLGDTNRAWLRHDEGLGSDKPRECEVYIDKVTGRVLWERMIQNFQGEPSKITCTYEYGDGPFPVGFTTKHVYHARGEYKTDFDFIDITKAKCSVVDGLWFITSYEKTRQASDTDTPLRQYLVENKDIKVTPLVKERNRK